MEMCSRSEKAALVAGYFLVAIGLGIHPNDRADWALENSIPFLEGLAAVLYLKMRGVELTPPSYYLIFAHLIVHSSPTRGSPPTMGPGTTLRIPGAIASSIVSTRFSMHVKS